MGPETVMVEVPETDRPPAPVMGVDVPVEAPTMADGSEMPTPGEDDRSRA